MKAVLRFAAARREPVAEPLWLEWATLLGGLAFASWLLGVRGVWALLLGADPTGLTLVIIVVFAGSTLWCGARARTLQREREAMQAGREGWALNYAEALKHGRDDDAVDLLFERTHGPHGAAWWVNGLQLKLGLLGKVIGFSILALTIGKTQGFEPSQSQELLKSLTSGLGVALLTTMVGLVGNILLGLQLTRLDRYADALVADIRQRSLRA